MGRGQSTDELLYGVGRPHRAELNKVEPPVYLDGSELSLLVVALGHWSGDLPEDGPEISYYRSLLEMLGLHTVPELKLSHINEAVDAFTKAGKKKDPADLSWAIDNETELTFAREALLETWKEAGRKIIAKPYADLLYAIGGKVPLAERNEG